MAEKAPIPTPPAVRWRELREGVLPYVVFAVVALVAVLLWHKRAARSMLVGQAETVRVNVAPLRAGTIAALKVELLQPVKQGDIVAQLIPADLEALAAGLSANVENLRATLGQDADRNLVNYQGLRLDWLRRNVELASARVERQLAESEYQRYAALHQTRTVTEVEFELRRANRDALKDKVAGLERLSAELEAEITRLRPAAGDKNPVDRAISAAVIEQQKQLQALADAGTLRAPMDGVVSTILKHPGETAQPGEIVLTIGALQPTRIIGYVRQPLNVRPKIGDPIDVQSRAGGVHGTAEVLRVGAQLEPIEPSLVFTPGSSPRVIEYGLPFVLSIPSGLNLSPGEIVALAPKRL